MVYMTQDGETAEVAVVGNDGVIREYLKSSFDGTELAWDNAPVKLARPSLVQFGKPSTGGTSGLHRAA